MEPCRWENRDAPKPQRCSSIYHYINFSATGSVHLRPIYGIERRWVEARMLCNDHFRSIFHFVDAPIFKHLAPPCKSPVLPSIIQPWLIFYPSCLCYEHLSQLSYPKPHFVHRLSSSFSPTPVHNHPKASPRHAVQVSHSKPNKASNKISAPAIIIKAW